MIDTRIEIIEDTSFPVNTHAYALIIHDILASYNVRDKQWFLNSVKGIGVYLHIATSDAIIITSYKSVHSTIIYCIHIFQVSTTIYHSANVYSAISYCVHVFQVCSIVHQGANVHSTISYCVHIFQDCSTFHHSVNVHSSMNHCVHIFQVCSTICHGAHVLESGHTSIRHCIHIFQVCSTVHHSAPTYKVWSFRLKKKKTGEQQLPTPKICACCKPFDLMSPSLNISLKAARSISEVFRKSRLRHGRDHIPLDTSWREGGGCHCRVAAGLKMRGCLDRVMYLWTLVGSEGCRVGWKRVGTSKQDLIGAQCGKHLTIAASSGQRAQAWGVEGVSGSQACLAITFGAIFSRSCMLGGDRPATCQLLYKHSYSTLLVGDKLMIVAITSHMLVVVYSHCKDLKRDEAEVRYKSYQAPSQTQLHRRVSTNSVRLKPVAHPVDLRELAGPEQEVQYPCSNKVLLDCFVCYGIDVENHLELRTVSGIIRNGILGLENQERGTNRDLPLTSPLHSCAAPYSPRFTLIGSQEREVNPFRPTLIYGARIIMFLLVQKRGASELRAPPALSLRRPSGHLGIKSQSSKFNGQRSKVNGHWLLIRPSEHRNDRAGGAPSSDAPRPCARRKIIMVKAVDYKPRRAAEQTMSLEDSATLSDERAKTAKQRASRASSGGDPQIPLRQREHLHSSVCPPACMLVAKTVGEWDASQGKPFTP
ncbi:hypothetical protein PR048_007693 [Dryococelus australis]|uniref:Uncharacterized protein n=1 Tax=Dryococelus australis TaxID=614101 RepID=A0ABQ9HV19_9NEOP|nr:hypothetical protein PR048_007693 [Dryococelus australis]